MLSLGYNLCDVDVMLTGTTSGAKSENIQLYYFDKIAGGRSTLVLAFKLRTKREIQLTACKRNE